jgi:glycosyltransferase involved in cell wall biosynthesis
VAGVHVHLIPHSYWRLVERFAPSSRDIFNRGWIVRRLDSVHRFDWIEIQSDEGIDIQVQRAFPEKAILRVHTTLAQMVHYKQVPATRSMRINLHREERSLRLARRIVVHSAGHANELCRLFLIATKPEVVNHGIEIACQPGWGALGNERMARFLVVGSADRRKGFDRIRPIVDAYARDHGPSTWVLVSRCPQTVRASLGLCPPFPEGVEVLWREEIDEKALYEEYANATALVHLSRYESFGYPLIETAACATPCVATPTGIAPELLSGDLSRWLIDGDDAACCARVLAEAKAARADLGRALYQRYLDRFTRDRMADAYLETLDRWSGAARGFEAAESPHLSKESSDLEGSSTYRSRATDRAVTSATVHGARVEREGS